MKTYFPKSSKYLFEFILITLSSSLTSIFPFPKYSKDPFEKKNSGQEGNINSSVESLKTIIGWPPFECIHAIQVNKDNRGEFCAYKLDLTKAYDRVDWKYLEGALIKLGFAAS